VGKSNEELQRLIDERDRELKIAQREAEKWKASSDLLESRVQGLVRMVNEMEEKMQARRRSVRRLYGQATQSVVHWGWDHMLLCGCSAWMLPIAKRSPSGSNKPRCLCAAKTEQLVSGWDTRLLMAICSCDLK
jgi:hypothetical protein